MLYGMAIAAHDRNEGYMAEQNEKRLFRESALNRIGTSDDLDMVLSVSNPRTWVTVLGLLVLLLGLVVWSATAVVPITTTTVALTDGAQAATCWVDEELAQELASPDVRVSVAGKEATSIVVQSRPRSSAEVVNSLEGSHVADGLLLAAWNYEVDLTFAEDLYAPDETDGQTSILAPAQIVTREEHPIALAFGIAG